MEIGSAQQLKCMPLVKIVNDMSKIVSPCKATQSGLRDRVDTQIGCKYQSPNSDLALHFLWSLDLESEGQPQAMSPFHTIKVYPKTRANTCTELLPHQMGTNRCFVH